MLAPMRTLVGSLALSLVLTSGCYVRGGGAFRFNSPGLRAVGTAARVATNVAATAAAVHTVAVILSTPPPMPVDVYYQSRPGYVWIHGHQSWNGSAYVWNQGYYEPQRQGQVYVDGYWNQTQGGYTYVDGYWTAPRPGYVYTEGYWNSSNGGYTWVSGQWQTQRQGQTWVSGSWSSSGNQRTYTPGRWSASASGSFTIR